MKRILLLFTLMVLSMGIHSISYAQCTSDFDTNISYLTVQFTNQASGSYNWIGYDYGDGNFSTYVASPTYTYAQPGIYVACQFIQDTIGSTCFDYTCDTLYLGGATCMADFFYFPDGFDVSFYNNSFGGYDQLLWDFGDGNTSTDTMPVHTYTTPGFYTVCLSLYDGSTFCDSACYTLYVDESDCDAYFTYSSNDLTVDFTNQSSGSYDGLYWDFGDGFGYSEDNDPTYTYFTEGDYNVCLYLYDTIGSCNSQYCETVSVTEGGGACDASFEYSTDQLSLVCTNTSTGVYLIEFWDFGDGSTPSTTGTHTYAAPGTYTVCLTIGNPFPFCADIYCQEVTVNEYTCVADFSYSFNLSTNVYQFSNLSTGVFTGVLWEFGDGNTSTFNNPAYTYNVPGTYEVCLTTFDGSNVCGYECEGIEVFPLALEEHTGNLKITASPNPTNGLLNLDIPAYIKGETVLLDIVDLGGRTVMSHSEKANASSIMVNLDLPAGVYYMKVSTRVYGSGVISVMVR